MKFAYITNGFSGNLHCSYELFRRLCARGHQVTYISNEDVGQRVNDNGFSFIKLSQEQQLTQTWSQLEPAFPGSPNWFKRLSEKRRLRAQMLDANELSDTLNKLDADALVIDIELHFIVIVCLQLKLPIILTIGWFTIFRDDQLPPMHTTHFPPQSVQDEKYIYSLWQKETRLKRRKRSKSRYRHVLRELISPQAISMQTLNTAQLEHVARHHSLALDELVDYDQWLRPMVFKDLPIVSFNAYEMDFPHQKNRNLHYVGAMVYEPRVEPGLVSDSTDKVEDQQQFNYQLNKDKPLIYCSLGTFWSTDRTFLERVIEVFRHRNDWRLVIGLGGKLSRTAFKSVPDNVTVLDWAPQLDIIKVSDCVITHGGITSINECVHYAVPMLVYSTAHGDQNGCAARVAWHGLGIRGDKSADTAVDIDAHIHTLITDAEYKKRLLAMQGHFNRYRQQKTAETLIEKLVMEGPSHVD